MSVHTKITVARLFDIIRRSVCQPKYTPTQLGRWGVDANKNINLVVDYSNEDHCGSCAQYIHEKHVDTIQLREIKDEFTEEYEYLLSNTQGH